MVQSGQWETTTGIVLSLEGRFVGFDSSGNGLVQPIELESVGVAQDLSPLQPTLTVVQSTRTSSSLSWNLTNTGGRPAIQQWDVQRRSSVDNGVTWSAWTAISGSPFSAATVTATETALASGTPEVIFQYRVRGVNSAGVGAWSAVAAIQWQTVLLQQPAAPTLFALTGKTDTTRTVTWKNPAANSSVTKRAIIDTDTGDILLNGISPTATTVVIPNLIPGQLYTNIAIASYNGWSGTGAGGLSGYSTPSNMTTFTQPESGAAPVEMMMGVSTQQTFGNIADWDGYRVYTSGRLYDMVPPKKTTNVPLFMAYSKDGPNIGGATPSYTAVYNEVRTDLEAFYYTTAGAHSVRWGIKLFWSNGNENSDKGAITLPHSATKTANYKISQKALWDACHELNADGTRRYPDAYAGSNPTQNHELDGIVEDWLHDTAAWHDFVMWSHYNPGRGSTLDDPTYNWDSMKESDRLNRTLGFLTRTYYRTKQAELAAQTDRPGHKIMICTGELGTGRDPNDSTTRPYYAAHGLAGTMAKLSQQYDLDHVFACWWDNDLATATNPGNGHDMLLDEAAGTNPSTAEAWRNWKKYNHEFGGTHPASWAGNPKPGWKTTGPVS